MANVLRKEHEDESPSGAVEVGKTVLSKASVAAGGPGTWLSPGRVIEVQAHGVRLQLPDGRELFARMALPLSYEAALGDELLLLGDATSAYVTGVLSGNGQTRLALKGDVSLATDGKLELSSQTSISLDAPSVEVRADRLHTVAGRVTEVFDSVRKTVRQLLSVRAGEQHTLVEGTSQLVAKNARTLSEGKVTINGKEIFLG